MALHFTTATSQVARKEKKKKKKADGRKRHNKKNVQADTLFAPKVCAFALRGVININEARFDDDAGGGNGGGGAGNGNHS